MTSKTSAPDAQVVGQTADAHEQPGATATRLDGVVIGVLVGFDNDRQPLVVYAGNLGDAGVAARSTAALEAGDVGQEVALLFEGGDPARPLVIGKIQRPDEAVVKLDGGLGKANVEMDGDRLTLSAEKEVVIRCGKASLTLTRAGKVIIRGAYLLSRSSGVNRIKGGSIQLN